MTDWRIKIDSTIEHEPQNRPSQTVGLIGVGLMGTALAERLMGAGHDVCGWDLVPDRCHVLNLPRGTIASGIAEVMANCHRVVLSLPSHVAVAEVLESAESVLRGGQIIIDMSTGDPNAAVTQSVSLSQRGIEYVDATVSGSSEQLRNGQAVILVGATAAGYRNCEDLFRCLAEKTFHTGVPGSGARTKLVTNLVLGLNRAALAEGLCFARHLDMDLDKTLQILRESMSYSRIMDTKGEKMLRGDFTPQARLSQHLKDVQLILSAAGTESYLPLTETHRMLLERAEQMGLGQLDNSAIVAAIAAGRREADAE